MSKDSYWSERSLIQLIAERSSVCPADGVIRGIGDDCAVFADRRGRNWLATTDILIEGVHFDLAWHPPFLLGRKAVAVNLSDIAAMGGTPHHALISVGIPDHVDNELLSSLTAGAAEMLRTYGCSLIGGDTARGPALTINVVILGSVEQGRAILRSGSAAGENIYVSGALGSAAAGLEICRHQREFGPPDDTDFRPLVEKHLNPEPRVELGRILGSSTLVGAMQDISDGLATDLAHICAHSGVGAELFAPLLPAHELLQPACSRLQLAPAVVQTTGGDDYELLLTVKTGRDDDLLTLIERSGAGRLYRVGRIVEGSGVRLIDEHGAADISFQGYQHRKKVAPPDQ